MKKLLLLLFFITNINCIVPDPKMVYVCDSRNAVRYHLKQNCRGLSNCSYKIVKITLEEAKKRKKTLCKWED